jgi:exosome complex component RRP41
MSETKSPTPLFREDGKRLDGRDINELRPLEIECGLLKRADGSATIRHGKNYIVVSVFGPRELHPKHLMLPDRALLRCEYRLASFSVGERKSPAPRRREHELSKIIKEALEPVLFLERYPRTTIDMYVQVLNADGGTRCASITAAAVALADAGIPMKGLVTSVAAGKAGGKIVLDLSDIEDKDGEGDLPIAISMHDGNITLLQCDGNFTFDEVKETIEMAAVACEKIHEIQRDALTRKYLRIQEEAKKESEIFESETQSEKTDETATITGDIKEEEG